MRSVAVAVDGPRPPAWQRKALDGIASSPALRLVDVREVPARGDGPVWRIHAAVERRMFGIRGGALAPAPVATRPEPGPADVLLWLSDAEPPADGDVLRLGHGPGFEPAPLAFRRAVSTGAPTVTSEVRDGSRVVARTTSGVRPFSATLSANAALWKAADMAVRALEGRPGPSEPAAAPPAPVPRRPGALFLARSAARWARMLVVRLLYRRPWFVIVRPRAETAPAVWHDGEGLVDWEPGHLYADPFLFERDGRHHLFCEHLPADAALAVISHVELREDGVSGGAPVPVLEADCHLSYPFVFEHAGEVFMIPETSGARRLELHRAVEFPRRWERDAVLMEDVDVSDATVVEQDGRLWMFASIAGLGASRLDELHLFWAESPRGPWTPHPHNPVVSDVRCGRPAGAILHSGGRLIRPAQDGSRRYGGAVSFREIDELTPARYAEHEAGRIDPPDVAGARAVHTYTRDSGFEAVDARRREPRVALLRRLSSRGRR